MGTVRKVKGWEILLSKFNGGESDILKSKGVKNPKTHKNKNIEKVT